MLIYFFNTNNCQQFSFNGNFLSITLSSPYNQVFFPINSIFFDTCKWMKLRLWSELYLIQGRYIVTMGTPNKTSSLFVLNGLDVYPSLYGSSPLMSNRIILLAVDLTSFVLPVHNQSASLATNQGHALWKKFLPATSSFFVLSLLIQWLLLQHLAVDTSCNHYGAFILWNYAALSGVPGRLISPSIFVAS